MCGVRACTCIQPLKQVPHARVPRSYRPRGSVFKYLYESSPRWFRITRAHIKSPEHCCPRARVVIVGYHRIRSQRYFIKLYTRLQLFYTHVVVDVVQYLWVNVASVFAAPPSNFQSNREILCLAYATSSFSAHAVFERRSVGFVSEGGIRKTLFGKRVLRVRVCKFRACRYEYSGLRAYGKGQNYTRRKCSTKYNKQ